MSIDDFDEASVDCVMVTVVSVVWSGDDACECGVELPSCDAESLSEMASAETEVAGTVADAEGSGSSLGEPVDYV